MKKVLLLVMVLLISFVLFASGTEENGTPEGPIEISYWGWGPHVVGVNETISPAFKEEYPNVTVKAEALGPWDLMDKFYVSMVSGKGAPDAAQLVRRVSEKYLISELLYDFTDFMNEYDGQFSEALNRDVLSIDDKYLGIPLDYGPSALFYNKPLAEKLGIDVSKIVTWDDFYELAVKISKENPDLYIMTQYYPAGTWGSNYFRMFMQSAGANIYDADGKVIRDNKKMVEVLEFLYKLHKDVKTLSIPVNDPLMWEESRKENILFYPRNSYFSGEMAQQVPEMEGDIHTIPWPLWSEDDNPQYTGNWGGVALVVPKKGANADIAAEFCKFFATNVDALTQHWYTTTGVPSYKPARDNIVTDTSNETFAKGLIEAITVREVGPWYYTDWAQTEKILGDGLDNMFGGIKTPAEAWSWTEEQLIKILGR
jgi:ABC-type glycerol-3-phosphate transport system substrate-binding protein